MFRFGNLKELAIAAYTRKILIVGCCRSGGLDMRKTTATARAAKCNFAKAYFEVKRLKGDVERIEKSLKWRLDKAPVADRGTPGDDRTRTSLQS